MTTFTRTWNAAYEAQPADTENLTLGADRIRDLKSDIQERGEVDHSWAGDVDDGEHKKITFQAPIAKPANVANKGFLYIKDVSAKAELHWEDEDANEIALTAAGSINAFASGTVMLFRQNAAPAGWTKDTASTFNNSALRIMTSGTWESTLQGATAFSTVFGSSKITGSHVLTTAEMPAHTHTIASTTLFLAGGSAGKEVSGGAGVNSGSTGGGGGHTHTLSLDLNYTDVILASKD